MNQSVESFGKILIREARDRAIRSMNMLLDNRSPTSAPAKYLRKMKDNGMDEYHKALVACCVDDALAYLMIAIDQEMLNLTYTDENGNAVDLVNVAKESGELSGWYRDWVETYSKELVPDLENDLEHIQ
jgi:hypothetical protein